jgi:signal transduction histidine kinase
MSSNLQIADLKRLITAELTKPIPDASRLQELSDQMADLDPNIVRFSIDAGLIDRLGQELVARQETAVSELVKNAHDADATEVQLIFIDSDAIGGTLKIQDDGDGMTRQELINGFMRISSSDKFHNPISRRYKRRRAGQKGIGRFAVQRLGSKLTIITQTEEAAESLMLTINWDDYKRDTDLTRVTNSIKLIKKHKDRGTTLIIERLRERWSDAAIKRIFNYITDIMQPFALSKEKQVSDDKRLAESGDPGFRFDFVKVTDNVPKTIKNTITTVLSHAVAEIEGYISEDGQGIYTIKSDKLNIDEIGEIGLDPDNTKAKFDKLSNVRFRAYYFIYDSDLIPKMQNVSIQRLAERQGGIKLYRNGFRVLPYGESGNDWLKLDESVRARTLLPAHANNSFFGFVELTDIDNKFKETSSREGLVEDEAFIQLQNFVYRTIITGVVKVAAVRGTKVVTNQKKDNETGNWEDIEVKIHNIALSIEELDKLEDEEDSPGKQRRKRISITRLKKDIADVAALQKQQTVDLIKETSMLRVLSSVGLTIGQFIHEIKYYIGNIQSDIRYLQRKLNDNPIAMERLSILDGNFATFHQYTAYFDKVVSQNVIRDLLPLDLRKVADQFVQSMTADAKKSNTDLMQAVVHGYGLFTIPMHPSEWSSILFNFYTNSVKAIKRGGKKGYIKIECGTADQFVYLEFSDNGDGISKEIEDRVFDEFFTTTSPSTIHTDKEYTDIVGSGLGLKIVKDIVQSYKGKVFVASPKEDYATCIRVEIPKASQKDLEKYGL